MSTQLMLKSTPVESDEIDIGGIVRTLLNKWRTIAVVAGLMTFASLISILTANPQFTINGSLYLGDAQIGPNGQGGAPSTVTFLAPFQTDSNVDTQVQLIQARPLVEQAILETGLNTSVTAEGTERNLDYWRWRFYYGKSIAAFAPKPGDIEALYATLLGQGNTPVSFDVIFGNNGAYRIVRPDHSLSSPETILDGKLAQPASGGGLSLLIKTSINGAMPRAGQKYGLIVLPASVVADTILNGLSVTAGGTIAAPAKIANLEFHWGNPYQGAHFVNQLMQDFIASQLSWTAESASATEQYLAQQLDNVQSSLTKANNELAQYQSQTGDLDVPENARSVIAELSQYDVQRTAIQLQLQALTKLAAEMANTSGTLNPYLVSQANDDVLGQLASTLASADSLLEVDRVQYTNDSTVVKVQEATVENIKASIRTLVDNDLALAKANLANITSSIETFEKKLKELPGNSLRIIELSHSSDVYGQLYIMLMQKKEEAAVSKATTIIDTRVVAPAEIPLRASKPKSAPTVATGFAIGVFAGVLFVLGQHFLSDRFTSKEEVYRAASVPIYAFVPKRSRKEVSNGVFSKWNKDAFSETFRLLRSNLYQSDRSQRSRVILITSATAGDGKTTLAANLAKSLADDGRRVLLVDADLHRGRVHETLKLAQTPGLTEWLSSAKEPTQNLPFQSVVGQRFSLLSAGTFPSNPSELLNHAFLVEIFNVLRADFDFVIVDCPPLPAVTDTISLGRFADLILSVVLINKTKKHVFAMHNDIIEALERPHGIIINGVTVNSSDYGYGYGQAT